MGKVREFAETGLCGTNSRVIPRLLAAEAEDAAAHAAELEAKDKRIAELEADVVEEDRAFMADIAMREKRIAELEAQLKGAQDAAIEWEQKCFDSRDAITRIGDAVGRHPGSHGTVEMAVRAKIAGLEAELAKRELPPLPESVRKWIECVRGSSMSSAMRDLISWVDTHYPAPVPQWELDAQLVERVGKGSLFEHECEQAAARIREAGRGNSK